MTVHFLIPGDLATRTGGYEYDRRIVAGLGDLGWTVDVCRLDGSFPSPTAAALAHADATLAAIPDNGLVLIDGLALGAMPDEATRHAARLRLLALVHHPLALETGIDMATATRLHESERRALAVVRHVVVTSQRTAGALVEFGVEPRRVSVVEPGTAPASLARGSGGDRLTMVCIASLSPRKGHNVLFRALAALPRHDWRLICVGSTEREPESVRGLREQVRALGLTDRIELVGEADGASIDGYYDRSDLFVLPTLYEGYGMVIAEALAHGLPVISTPTGAIAELVTDAAGILVAPGDVNGWTAALTRMFDPTERAAFRQGAAARRAALPGWEEASRRMAAALTQHG